jgi:hypothetical protein
MTAQPLDQLCASDDDPRLRSAEQLVAGEADDVRAGGEARARSRLVADVHQRARAEVVDEDQPVIPRNPRQLRDRRQLREADDAEVRLVHAQQHGSVRADSLCIVTRARSVRRADLSQARARTGQHVRNPEAVTDLDQLTARDEHVPAFRQRRERQQHRGGVVVDDERGLRAREPAQELGDVRLARAARPGVEVVLEVRVAARRGPDLLERRRRERCAPQVRVHDDARSVQHASQPRCVRCVQLRSQLLLEVARIRSLLYLFARAREDGAGGSDGERVVVRAGELVDGGEVAKPHGATATSKCSERSSARASSARASGSITACS